MTWAQKTDLRRTTELGTLVFCDYTIVRPPLGCVNHPAIEEAEEVSREVEEEEEEEEDVKRAPACFHESTALEYRLKVKGEPDGT